MDLLSKATACRVVVLPCMDFELFPPYLEVPTLRPIPPTLPAARLHTRNFRH